MNDEPSTCPHCGKPASQKLLGMCPQCMLKAGLGGFSAEGSIPEPATRFIPPTVEELGRYFPQLEILELIGRGGMGAVYKARQKQLDRLVALKILPPGIGGKNTEVPTPNAQNEPDPDATAFAQRFTREAKALAALAHPNIVTLYEFGQAFPGPRTSSSAPSAPSDPKNAENQPNSPRPPIFFFLMEYVDGMNLRQLLAGGRLAPKEALAIVPHICDALQYAHDRGIVHRDIKPENILLGRDGVVKIADFGVAKIIGKPETPTAETGTGQETAATIAGVAGTPAYMAPEQLDRPAEVDHRADIYSLGVVLYQMLTGELPGRQIEPPSRKVQIDVRIDEIVMRALERNPDMRYSQASLFKTEVETIASEGTEGRTPKPAPLAAGEAFDGGGRFSRTAIAGAVGIALSAIAMCWIATISGQGAGDWRLMKSVEKLGFVLTESLFVLGFLVSPLATPILGWIAILKIRRSGRRLRGMWLAVLDGLLFPLLAIDGLLMWVSNALFHYYQEDVVFSHGQTGGVSTVVASVTPFRSPTILLMTILLVVGLDVLIARWVWGAVNKPLHGQQQSPPPRVGMPRFGTARQAMLVLGGGVLFFAAAFAIWRIAYEVPGSLPRSGWQERPTPPDLSSVEPNSRPISAEALATWNAYFDLSVEHQRLRMEAAAAGKRPDYAELTKATMALRDRLAQLVRGTPAYPLMERILRQGRELPNVNPQADRQRWDKFIAQVDVDGFLMAIMMLDAGARPDLRQRVANMEFGPWTEATLSDVSAGKDYFLSFQTGQLLTPPADVLKAIPKQWLDLRSADPANPVVRWCRDNKADLALESPNSLVCLVAAKDECLIAQPSILPDWDNLVTPQWLAWKLDQRQQFLKTSMPNSILTGLDLFVKQPGRLCLFRTNSGTFGMLQILESTQSPPQMKIRYKLLQERPISATWPSRSEPPTTTPSDVRPEPSSNSANGLTIDCRPSSGQYRVGEKVLIWCTLTNSTKQTKPVAYNTIGGSHFTLISGVEVFEKTSNNIQVLPGGILPTAIPQIREPLTVRSGHPETEQILDLPAGKSIQFVLDCGPAQKPQNFTGRIIYDPAASHAAFLLRPDDLLATSVSNVFTYRIAEQQEKP